MTSHYVSGGSSESYSSGYSGYSSSGSSGNSSYGDYDSDSDYSDMSIYSATSVLTTPHVRKVASMRNGQHDEKMKALQRDLEGYIVNAENFEQFIRNVYGVSGSDVKSVYGKEWTLNATHLAQYQLVLARGGNETCLYEPFKGIVDSLYTTIKGGELVKRRFDTTLVTLGNTELECPYTGTKRKPDCLFLYGDDAETSLPRWSRSKVHVEMYKTRRASKLTTLLETLAEAPPSTSGTGVASNTETRSTAQARRQLPKTSRSGTTTTKKRPSRPRAATQAARETRSLDLSLSAPTATIPPAISPSVDNVFNAGRPHALSGRVGSSRASGKRSREPEPEKQRKRHHSDLTRKAAQSAGYALEALSATPRRWATGLLVRNFDITVQYYDRCGAIFAPPFNFQNEPKKLALLALAIGQATPAQAGFEPFFIPAGLTSLSAPPSSVVNSKLWVPSSADYSAKDLRMDLTVPDDTWSSIDISGDPLYVYRGVNGRGSIILPGRFAPARKEAKGDGRSEGPIEGTTEQADHNGTPASNGELLGDTAHEIQTAKTQEDEDLGEIVKLSWPDRGRRRQEPELLQLLSDRIPWMREHLPEVLAAVTMNVHVAGLPRGLFIDQAIEEQNMQSKVPSNDQAIEGLDNQSKPPSNDQAIEEHSDQLKDSSNNHAVQEYSNQLEAPSNNQTIANFKAQFELGIRHFTILIVRRYQHLWEVKNVKDFEKIYVDLVECHHHAYRYAKILHRDLSENNLLWKRKDGNALGVLNDFDLASLLDEEKEDKKNRTGTGPFMARDLLNHKYTGGHLYRHDLESLFYVLVWAAAHYDLGAEEPRHDVKPPLEPWTAEYETALCHKLSFFVDVDRRDEVYGTVLPIFEDLRKRWLIPLWDMFSKAMFYARFEQVKLEDAITFEVFMNTLGYKPRAGPQNQQLAV